MWSISDSSEKNNMEISYFKWMFVMWRNENDERWDDKLKGNFLNIWYVFTWSDFDS